MKLHWIVLLLIAWGVCHADDKPNPLEREGDPLPVVKMPLAKIPTPMQAFEAKLLDRAYPPGTEVAIEGNIEVDDPKNYQSFKLMVRFSVKEEMKPGWKTIVVHRGGEPVKVKEGLYRYRSVIKTPPQPGIYFVHAYNHEGFCMAMAKVDVDEDAE
jgi:hypothetical protein